MKNNTDPDGYMRLIFAGVSDLHEAESIDILIVHDLTDHSGGKERHVITEGNTVVCLTVTS